MEEERFCYEEETQLTVMKTSHFFVGDGFTVYDSKTEVLFRVESYGHDHKDRNQLVLMDASGNCLLTVHKKRPSLHHRWEGFVGERLDQEPIFSVRRSSIMGLLDVKVVVNGKSSGSHAEEYHIEGSYAHRCCTFYNSSREPVAAIKRKMAVSANNVVLDKDVFCLCLKPGFDCAFAMAIVLILDQINGGDDADANLVDDDTTHPTVDVANSNQVRCSALSPTLSPTNLGTESSSPCLLGVSMEVGPNTSHDQA